MDRIFGGDVFLLQKGKEKSSAVWYNRNCQENKNTIQGRTVSMQSIAELHEENKLEVIQGTGEILSDVADNGRKRPWDKHKKASQKLAELFVSARELEKNLISDSRLQALSECGSFLFFDRNIEQKLRLNRANFCRVRLCPMCSWRKSLKLFGQVSRIVDELLNQQLTTRFIFVTLTVPNCKADRLTKVMNDINKAFSYLTNINKTFARAKRFKENLLGYMKAMEVTYNQRTDTYHPHIHCLFAIKSAYFSNDGYITKSEWQGIWSQAMNSNRELIVHVETIKNSTSKAVAEMSKYPVKPTDVLKIRNKNKAVIALTVLHSALRNRRLVTFGGLMAEIKRALNLEDVDASNADLIHVDSEKPFVPVEQVLYRWCKIGAYVC